MRAWIFAFLFVGCGTVDRDDGADADSDTDADTDSDSDTGSDEDFCSAFAAHMDACDFSYAEAAAVCACSSCAMRADFARDYFACANDLACSYEDSGFIECYEDALANSPPGPNATDYDEACAARSDACDLFADDPDHFKCEGGIGLTEEAAAAGLTCLDGTVECHGVRNCLLESLAMVCPECS